MGTVDRTRAQACELLCVVANALLGKETFDYFAHRAKGRCAAVS
jgi:hypothetical protein